MRPTEIISTWGKVLGGKTPLLSIEITRECPLHYPGCYADGEGHLGGLVNLRDLSDFRDDSLIQGVLQLVARHDPMQVTLVGGEPLMRAHELSKLLAILSSRGVFTTVVCSGVIPIPREWTALPRITFAISGDGLPQHHGCAAQARHLRTDSQAYRRPARVYSLDRGSFTRRKSRLPRQYLSFWSAHPEVHRI